MINLKSITDQWEIKKALVKDHLYLEMYKTDDLYSENVTRDNMAWFLIEDKEEIVGLLLLKEFSNFCVMPHGGIYKEFRNKRTLQITKEILETLNDMKLRPIMTIASKNFKMKNLVNKLGYTKHICIKNGCPEDDLLIFGEI